MKSTLFFGAGSIAGFICAFVLIALVGVGSTSSPRFAPAPRSESESEPISTSGPTATPLPTPEPLEWTGSGGDLLEFDIVGFSAVTVAAQHKGRSNFIINLKKSNGELVGVAANCIGDCKDAKLIRLEGDGDYVLDITADGEWAVIVEPKR